jgi:hypothetical protein
LVCDLRLRLRLLLLCFCLRPKWPLWRGRLPTAHADYTGLHCRCSGVMRALLAWPPK